MHAPSRPILTLLFVTACLFFSFSTVLGASPGYEAMRAALASGKPTMVDLGADYCPPCQKMKPILDALQKEVADRYNILVIDVEEEKALANRLHVSLIPTQIFYDKSGKEFDRHVGFMDRAQILAVFERMK